jgi:hypothetical protein
VALIAPLAPKAQPQRPDVEGLFLDLRFANQQPRNGGPVQQIQAFVDADRLRPAGSTLRSAIDAARSAAGATKVNVAQAVLQASDGSYWIARVLDNAPVFHYPGAPTTKVTPRTVRIDGDQRFAFTDGRLEDPFPSSIVAVVDVNTTLDLTRTPGAWVSPVHA